MSTLVQGKLQKRKEVSSRLQGSWEGFVRRPGFQPGQVLTGLFTGPGASDGLAV